MLKRGLLFLLVFIIFLQNSLAQECLVASEENVPIIARNILQTYSQLYPEDEVLQAALDSLDRWQPENIDSNWINFKESIKDEIRRTTSSSGNCIDDYSLKTKDDCWNNDGLCVEGNGCVGFEDMGWSEDVLENVRKLRSPDSNIRTEAVFQLKIQYSVLEALEVLSPFEKELSVLIKLLETDPDPYVRSYIVETLGDVGSNKSILTLLRSLETDPDPYVRTKIVIALGNTHSLEAVHILVKILNTDQSDNLREEATYALGKIGSPEAVQALVKIIENPNEDSIRLDVVVSALGNTHSLEAVPILARVLDTDISHELKFNIIRSLGKIGSPEAVQALVKILENPNEDFLTRAHVAYALGNTLIEFRGRDPALEAGRALVKILENPNEDPFIRARVEEAIGQSSPPTMLEFLRKDSLFEMIYTSKMLSQSSTFEKNSVSVSVYRHLFKNFNGRNEFTDSEIEGAIDFILSKRKIFGNKVIFGQDKYILIFNHEDPKMIPGPIMEFARERGITRFYPDLLKGLDSKEEIKRAIRSSKNQQRETVIWVNTHGLRNYICLSGGIPDQDGSINEESCFGFRYDEFADILLQRGNLDEVTLVIDSCFGFNFAEQLLDELNKKHARNFPVIITSSNKGKLAFGSLFLQSLDSLNLAYDEPLLGKHIYEAEQYSFERQDSAVFFSEDGTSLPLEIAMDSLNPSDCGCTEFSCPIEPIQGTPS